MIMKLDILVIAVHPDDAELMCGGTIAKHISLGKKVGIVDLTEGQLGSRGSVELRYQEAAKASEVLKLTVRENLKMMDGYFEISKENKLKIIAQIRRFQPEIVICNAIKDRHPDHGRASQLASEACFYSGLRKIETQFEGKEQKHWRPKAVYHAIQDRFLPPDLIVDISDHYTTKVEAIKAFSSQFFDSNSDEPITPISGPDFFAESEGMDRQMGRLIGAKYGEGFTTERPVGVEDITTLI